MAPQYADSLVTSNPKAAYEGKASFSRLKSLVKLYEEYQVATRGGSGCFLVEHTLLQP